MPRLTIKLSSERHRAVKEAAARSGKTIGCLIDESLELAGIKTTQEVSAILEAARLHSGMDEDAALDLGVQETSRVRSR